jgi:hypothetical protein
MKKTNLKWIGQVIIYSPLAAVLGSSFLNVNAFQRQVLMLILLIWSCVFFLYRSWLTP